MNILQIVSKLDASDAAEDVISSTKFLAINGYKVVVVSEESKRIREIDEVGARHYIIPLKPNIMLMPFSIFKISRIISKENIHVVHARCPISSFAAFFASRLTDRPLISTVYEPDPRGLFGRSQGWAKRVVLFSETLAHHLVRAGFVSQGKVRVIPPFVENGKSTHFFRSNYEKNGRSSHFNIGLDVPLFSSEATQNFIKAASTLSRTIHRMKVFVIDSTPSYGKEDLEKLKLLIRRHSLDKIVTFFRLEEKKDLLSCLDLFVQINLDEDLYSRPFLQAEAHGIPAITTRVDQMKELAPTILDLYRNEKSRGEMANKAKETVKEKFNQRKIMGSISALYQEAASSINILIIKIGALGDVILIVPSLRAIREKFPKAKITLLVGIDNREVLANSPYIDEIMVCDFKRRDKTLGGFLSVARRLRSRDFDIVIDFQNNKKSHILSFLSCAPKRYGYDNGKLSFLLNRKIKDKGIPMEPIEHQLKVLNLLGILNIDKRLELWPSQEDEKWADDFMSSHWIGGKNRVLAVNMGSSPRWVTKLWPAEYFAEVSNRLVREFGIRTVLVGLKDESHRLSKFLKRATCKPIDALGKTSIPRLASLIKRCNLLISSDSAPIHVAASVGTPCIVLFGPTDPPRHLAPAKKFAVIKKDLKCSPCYHTYCDRKYECMRSITPDEVYEAAVKLLGIKKS